jgi:hypothetical protein
MFTRFKSWYDKAKDSAVGSAFADHVMGGVVNVQRLVSARTDNYIVQVLDEILHFGR